MRFIQFHMPKYRNWVAKKHGDINSDSPLFNNQNRFVNYSLKIFLSEPCEGKNILANGLWQCFCRLNKNVSYFIPGQNRHGHYQILLNLIKFKFRSACDLVTKLDVYYAVLTA